jgi:rhodanese-related sulfurtransferase
MPAVPHQRCPVNPYIHLAQESISAACRETRLLFLMPMKPFVLIGLLFCCTVQALLAQDVSWAALRQLVRTRFPDVPQMSTETLATRLARKERILLLDTRKAEEYAVSHLAGAIRVDPEATTFPMLAQVPKDAILVAYCSVGYRSSEVVQRLRQQGFRNAYNLEGSIFQWANEGRPVVRGEALVRQVHPYDARWGVLLKAELRAYTPR